MNGFGVEDYVELFLFGDILVCLLTAHCMQVSVRLTGYTKMNMLRELTADRCMYSMTMIPHGWYGKVSNTEEMASSIRVQLDSVKASWRKS